MFANSWFSYIKGFETYNNVYFGLDALNDANYYQSPITGALNGNSGSGNFYIQTLIRIDTNSPNSGSFATLASNRVTSSLGAGWRLGVNTDNTIQFGCYNTGSIFSSITTAAVSSSTIGQIIHLCAVHTSTSLKLYLNGILTTSGTFFGYTAPNYNGSTARLFIGKDIGPTTSSNGNITVFGLAGGNTIPTDDEIYQAYIDSRTFGDLVHIPQKTNHLYSVKQSQTGSAPATITDQFDAAPLSKQGSPVIAVSLPSNITMYGLDEITDSNYYASPVSGGIEGISGSGNFWATSIFSIDSQNVTSQIRTVVGTSTITKGWWLRANATNTSLFAQVINDLGVSVNTPTYTIASTDVNKIFVATVVHSSSLVQLFVNGTQVGAGTANANGYRASDSSFKIGRNDAAGFPLSSSVKVYGICGGSGSVPTSAEILQQYNSIKASGDIVEIPGRTQRLYSVGRNYVASGSVVPGTIVDQISGNNLSKVGSPIVIVDTGPNLNTQ